MDAGFRINGRVIECGEPVYIVAELSANHHQDFDKAVELVREAKKAGADAVKIQTYRPDTITLPCRNEYFRIGPGTMWEGRYLYDLYEDAYTPWEWQPELKKEADRLRMDLFSTPFDDSAVDFLEEMGVPAYKIASFEVVDIPLIEKVAATGKPIILSTGMASLSEIDEAVRAVRRVGDAQVALLKCTSAYPAPPGEMNLRTIPHLSQALHVPVGLSDHTLGIAAPVAAVALGACIIEKHFTLSRTVAGPDTAFSLEPCEFAQMVTSIRETEAELGEVSYEVTEHEKASRVFRRSLFAARDIRAGDEFTGENVRSIRPGYGLPPRYLREVLGKRSRKDIPCGTPLQWDHII
jgi:N-acetylneuraminate synthase